MQSFGNHHNLNALHKTFEGAPKRWAPLFTSCVVNKNTVGVPFNILYILKVFKRYTLKLASV